MSLAGEGGKVAGATPTASISFTLPALPPSSNSLYNVLFSQRRVELKPEARLWRSNAKEFIPRWTVETWQKVKVSMTFCGRWMTQEGKIRKVDVTNREKLVLDAICTKQGWDDSQVWERCVYKEEAEREAVKVSLSVVTV